MSAQRKKILILFTELAGYIVACIKKLAESEPVDIHVIRWPVNAVAPFRFSLEGEHIRYYERDTFNNPQLVAFAVQLNPDVIFCSGWIDKGYNAVCRHFKGKIPTVMGLDNPWRNTLKQHIASLAGSVWLKNYFSHCWIPGQPQMKYALKLGFPESHIATGAYSCDFDAFHRQYLGNRERKAKAFPKKIIFVGRYTALKGTEELWKAFEIFQKEEPSEWELWCLGKGELDSRFPKHEKIKNIGFVQPDDMHSYISQCGVFILPSHYEHWGVVVHEFAAAGFPLVCTSSTGAATAFLRNGYNGFSIEPFRTEPLVDVFKKINRMRPEELLTMGDRSAELAAAITPVTWSKTFMKFLTSH